MLSPKDFLESLICRGVEFFTGVPDSLLRPLCDYISDTVPLTHHIISANEGGAIGLGIGYHLATGKIPLIYLQNSGLGNTINPLLSLADPDVYSIPMLLIIGWRGEPGIQDEPQHKKQGRVTLATLETLDISYELLKPNLKDAQNGLEKVLTTVQEHKRPAALVVRKGTFSFDKSSLLKHQPSLLLREEVIQLIVDSLDSSEIIVSTTGVSSRELYEYRETLQDGHERDFLTVGGMGHASQIALGIAIQKPNIKVYCLDGDGAMLMHMGSLAIIGDLQCHNYKHILINNGVHDSVGGQRVPSNGIDFLNIAKSFRYRNMFTASSGDEVRTGIQLLRQTQGPGLLEVRTSKGFRNHLGRPSTTPLENKEKFMSFLSERL